MAWKYFAFDVNEQAFGPGGYTIEFTSRWVGRGKSQQALEKSMAKEFWANDEDERQPSCAGFEEITEEQFKVAVQIGVPGHVVETR